MNLNLLKSLDADDIFISYSRRDGEAYLTGLDAALSARGFSCFTDKRGTDAGRLPPETLYRKIRRCKTLVLLATPGALNRPENITPELEKFSEDNGTSRIVVVSFDRGADFADWSKTGWDAYLVGKSREREDPQTLVTGKPSDSAVESIARASDYMKSKDRLRKYRDRALMVLAGLVLLSAGAGVLAWYQLRRAGDALQQARLATDKADAETARAARATQDAKDAGERAEAAQAEANRATAEAERATAEANRQKEIADLATKDAEEKTKLADEAARRAREATEQARRAEAEAATQQTIAEARRLANSSQALLRQRPAEVPESLRRAANAMEKSGSVKMHLLEADMALRDTLALLPRTRPDATHTTRATIALSPDGGHFAELGADNELRVYQTGSKQPSRPPIPCECSSVALNSGASYAAAILNEGGVKMIGLRDERLTRTLSLDGGTPAKIALSPGGRYLALSFTEGEDVGTYSRLLLVDTSDGKTVKAFDEEEEGDAGKPGKDPVARLHMLINDIAFGPDGSLAVGGKYLSPERGRFTGRVAVWHQLVTPGDAGGEPELAADSIPDPEIIPQDSEVQAVAPGGDDTYFATDTGVWKRMSGQTRFEPVARFPYALEGPPPSTDDPDTPVQPDQPWALEVRKLAFTPDGRTLMLVRHLPSTSDDVEGNEHEVLETWDAAGHWDLAHVIHESRIDRVGFRPGDQTVAAMSDQSGKEGGILVFRTGDGAEVKSDDAFGPGDEDGSLLYASPGEGLFVTARDQTARVWDVWGKRTAAVPFGDVFEKLEVATLSPGGRFLALSGLPRKGSPAVVVVYTSKGESYEAWKRPVQNGILEAMSLSRDGRVLAVLYHGDQARVYDVERETDATPKSLMEFIGVEQVALSPDGRHLAAAGRDNVTRLLDLSKGRGAELSPLLEDTRLGPVAFSPDGRYLGLGSEEGILHVFDMRAPKDVPEIARLRHTGAVNAIAFSGDGRFVASASADPHPYRLKEEESYALRVWLLRPADLLVEARERLEGLPVYKR